MGFLAPADPYGEMLKNVKMLTPAPAEAGVGAGVRLGISTELQNLFLNLLHA
jgi:hypothetical protein